ncbi:MAG TPA: group II intron reverse transcriptase/maturase [Candidatus Saccharimonadales bacterium]|nr:group II intron reverse transcriptase/maturase [Candidatus Saccharimonadales bacterium]
MTKPFDIPKQLFVDAFKHVKANAGAAGVDRQSLEEFERNLKDNTYKLWNRMSSGSYFPPSVMAVPIPKKSGGSRILGIPTVADRIAQQVVRSVFEPEVEKHFLPDSYGYRPNKSALDAIGITRKRCWRYDWVLEYDIKGLFDNIPHDLLMKAVHKHTECKWAVLYIERWLKAPLQISKDEVVARNRGTPQGGVISPVLSNLFLHYIFDLWMQRHHSDKPWCRYADDGLIHCETEEQAQQLLKDLRVRFEECGLDLHPEKTRIIYCKDGSRKEKHTKTSFDFLGYTFRGRRAKRKDGTIFLNFCPAVSRASLKAMRKKTRQLEWRNRTELSLTEIAERYNPVLQGWLNYYGAFYRSAIYPVWQHFNMTLVAWAMKKYKKLKGRKMEAEKFIENIARKESGLFVHWRQGITQAFV